MIDRRGFLGAAASLAYAPQLKHAKAEDGGESAIPLALPEMSNSEKMMYSTVRLVGKNSTTTSAGTGFFFQLFEGPKTVVLAIVTNRHVVDNMDTCSFTVHKSRLSRPTNDNFITIDITRFHDKLFYHPTEDLAIINVVDEVNNLRTKGSPPYIVSLHAKDIPSQETIETFIPIEDVLTIGYPGVFFDASHSIPLFHAGHTATPLYLPFKSQIIGEDKQTIYNNSKTFLVDFTTWSGASGSPVFLYNTNGYIERSGLAHFLTTRLALIGVVQGLATQSISGKFEFELSPNKVQGTETVAVPTNLGICLSSSFLLDFEDIMLNSGFKPTWDYTKVVK
jgi:hypothetical protein